MQAASKVVQSLAQKVLGGTSKAAVATGLNMTSRTASKVTVANTAKYSLLTPQEPLSFAARAFTSAARAAKKEVTQATTKTGPLMRTQTTGFSPFGLISKRVFSQQAVKPSSVESASGAGALEYIQMFAGLGAFLAADNLLKKAAAAAGISFPPPLIGMFGIISTLGLLSGIGRQQTADAIVKLFRPSLTWLQRWLPLFYVAPLIVLPVALSKMDSADAAKLGSIVVLGLPFSLFATAGLVVLIRAVTKTTLLPVTPTPPLPPFNTAHFIGWASAAIAGLAGMVAFPQGTTIDLPTGPVDAVNASTTLFLLSTTIFGLVFGSVPPSALAAVMPHPVVTTAIFGNIACAVSGTVKGDGYFAAMKDYLTKGAGGAPLGAGDVLMGFLGCVILSFGFHIYGQRTLMRRHAPEVLGCAVGSAFISLIGTCMVARLLQLPPEIALASAPRCVTVALALPIAETVGVPPEFLPVCAAAVVATGLLGAATCQKLLNLGRFSDPVTRGMATAGSCHGLGTAALAAKEPEALPFCALAYGLIGIAATCWASIPAVRQLMRTICGFDDDEVTAVSQS